MLLLLMNPGNAAPPHANLPHSDSDKDASSFLYDVGAKLLPQSFEPSPNSVIIGKGRVSKIAEGNARLRTVAEKYLEQYAGAKSKSDKSEIIRIVIEQIRSRCPVGAFIKYSERHGRWIECPLGVAREKVGYCFRDLLTLRYKSSKASKKVMRRQKKPTKPTPHLKDPCINPDLPPEAAFSTEFSPQAKFINDKKPAIDSTDSSDLLVSTNDIDLEPLPLYSVEDATTTSYKMALQQPYAMPQQNFLSADLSMVPVVKDVTRPLQQPLEPILHSHCFVAQTNQRHFDPNSNQDSSVAMRLLPTQLHGSHESQSDSNTAFHQSHSGGEKDDWDHIDLGSLMKDYFEK